MYTGIRGICMEGPSIALSVTDLLDDRAVVERTEAVVERTRGLDSFDAICVRDDIRSPDAFACTAAAVASVWDGGIILESSEASCLTAALSAVEDRNPLIRGSDRASMDMMASIFGCAVAYSSESLEDLLDMVRGSPAKHIVLDPCIKNMKGCLETGTDLHRLSGCVPEADRPFLVRTWSGEYALSMASVALHRYCSIVVVDDLDRDCCEVLDGIAGGRLR